MGGVLLVLRDRLGGQLGGVAVVPQDGHGWHEVIVGEGEGREGDPGQACAGEDDGEHLVCLFVPEVVGRLIGLWCSPLQWCCQCAGPAGSCSMYIVVGND